MPDAPTHAESSLTPLLVYRDRIGTPSEIQFLRRQYLGFTRLAPVWVGRHVMPGAAALGGTVLRLGDEHPAGWLERLLFRHFGCVPRLDIGPTANVVHAQFARAGALALPLVRSLGKRLVVTLHGGDVSKVGNWQADRAGEALAGGGGNCVALRLCVRRGGRHRDVTWGAARQDPSAADWCGDG